MGIGTDKQRAADALGAAVITNRLTDRQHMCLIETVRQRAATMPGSTERDPLARNAKVRLQLKIGRQQRRDISQQGSRCRLTGQRVNTRAHNRLQVVMDGETCASLTAQSSLPDMHWTQAN